MKNKKEEAKVVKEAEVIEEVKAVKEEKKETKIEGAALKKMTGGPRV